MDLSIIIVNWNTKEYLLQCLGSIFNVGQNFSWEVIVVDNASQDGSEAEAKKKFPTIQLIENEENLGFAKATNQGLRKAEGRYLLLLNPDTQVKEGALERLIVFMDVCPEAGVVGPQLLNSDGSKQNSIANFPSVGTELLNKSLLRWLFPSRFPGKGENYLEPIEVESVIGACMMVRREAMEEVGVLDEDYFLFFEETDWCFQIKKAGWKIYHLPHAEVYHLQGKSAEKEKKKAKVEYYRSRYQFFKKNRGGLQWSILLIGLIIKLMAEFVLMGMVNLLTGFAVKKWRKRFSVYAYLLSWHLRFCPEGIGLKPAKKGDRLLF
ncbi:MAG: glycosyltransferase family 2 protein [Thermodesulfobacteriota bacterium]|nr:glycosyltransferase family 2 protein [Thermodesulfobacteriota bacterium]